MQCGSANVRVAIRSLPVLLLCKLVERKAVVVCPKAARPKISQGKNLASLPSSKESRTLKDMVRNGCVSVPVAEKPSRISTC